MGKKKSDKVKVQSAGTAISKKARKAAEKQYQKEAKAIKRERKEIKKEQDAARRAHEELQSRLDQQEAQLQTPAEVGEWKDAPLGVVIEADGQEI